MATSLKPESQRFLPWLYIVGGALALLASFEITQDKFKLLANPNFIPACSLNPVISCGSVMKSAQAAVFGFPNPIIGLVGFGALITLGVSLWAGAKFPAWYWRLVNLPALFGVGMVHWLFFQSVYRIQALCPWCMLVWAVTIPVFFYTTLANFQAGYLPAPSWLASPASFIQRYRHVILLLWCLVIAVAILSHFWYYFKGVI